MRLNGGLAPYFLLPDLRIWLFEEIWKNRGASAISAINRYFKATIASNTSVKIEFNYKLRHFRFD